MNKSLYTTHHFFLNPILLMITLFSFLKSEEPPMFHDSHLTFSLPSDSDVSYNSDFMKEVLSKPEIRIKYLYDWFYPDNRKDYIPFLYELDYGNMKVKLFSEVSLIIWVQSDANNEINNINELISAVQKIIKIPKSEFQQNSIIKYPDNCFSIKIKGWKHSKNYILWNKNNWIYINEPLRSFGLSLARQDFKYIHSSRPGLCTQYDDKDRKEKLTQWAEFTNESIRKKLSDVLLNACIWPTESAGQMIYITPKEIFPLEDASFR